MLDQLLESSLFSFELFPMILNPFAPLCDLNPAENVIFADTQLVHPLAGFHLADHLVDQRHRFLSIIPGHSVDLLTLGSLTIHGSLLGFSRFDYGLQVASDSVAARSSCEFFRISFRIHGLYLW